VLEPSELPDWANSLTNTKGPLADSCSVFSGGIYACHQRQDMNINVGDGHDGGCNSMLSCSTQFQTVVWSVHIDKVASILTLR